MWLVSIVRAPLKVTAPARRRPFTVAPLTTVIEVSARMVPSRSHPPPMVAELPTIQKTFSAFALLIRRTLQLGLVSVSVGDPPELGIWKTQTALGSPCASRVRFPPVISNDLLVTLEL